MASGKHALQQSVAGNKISTFEMVRVQMKYGEWQGTLACGSMKWDVK